MIADRAALRSKIIDILGRDLLLRSATADLIIDEVAKVLEAEKAKPAYNGPG